MQITYNIVEVKVPYNPMQGRADLGTFDRSWRVWVYASKNKFGNLHSQLLHFMILRSKTHTQKKNFSSQCSLLVSSRSEYQGVALYVPNLPLGIRFPYMAYFKWLDNRTGLLYSPKLPLKTKFGNAAKNLQATALQCSKVHANPRGQRSVHGCYEIVQLLTYRKGMWSMVNLSPACLKTHVPDVLILLTPDTVEMVSLYITVTVCTDGAGGRYKVSS